MKREKLKNGLNKAWDVAKKGCKIVIPILVTVMCERSRNNLIDEIRYSGNVKYEDAVNAISKSSMFSSDKRNAMQLVKRGETSEYYKAIISMARSTMFSSDKVSAIKNMNTQKEES